MSTFTTRTDVTLSSDWVEDLLVTAFDSGLGGCWYWVNAEDDIVTVRVEADHAEFDLHGLDLSQWTARRVDAAGLERAWAVIVDQKPIRSDLVEQFVESMRSGDLDVDADAADCLVQIALFGEVIYG